GGAADADVDFAVARYNADGSLDASFGVGGEVTTDFNSSFNVALSVALQTDGRIVAAGISGTGGGDADFALARYNAGGSLDTTFGMGGKVLTDFGPSSGNVANSVAVQADGKIV